jgi:hypothetical protein
MLWRELCVIVEMMKSPKVGVCKWMNGRYVEIEWYP